VENTPDAELAVISRAAEHRRIDDLAKWLRLERGGKPAARDRIRRLLRPRIALTNAFTVLMITFTALASASAVVHAGKPPQVVLKPSGPMPAVNVP
jgi:hypothetical protein